MRIYTVNWIGVTGGLRDPEYRTPSSPQLRLLAPETGGGRFALDPLADCMEQQISVQMGLMGHRLRLPVTKNKLAPGSTRFAFLHDPKTMLGQLLGHGPAVREIR